MNGNRVPSGRYRRGAAVAAGVGLLAAGLLALAGCSSNTPTAAGSIVIVGITGETAAGPSDTVSGSTSGSASPATGAPPTAAGPTVVLPDHLAGLQTLDTAATARGGDRAKSTVEINDRRQELTAQAYSNAYGLPAAVLTYADQDLTFVSTVIVVAAPSPGLTVGPVGDPADLGLAVNMTTVVQDGYVQCSVNTGEAVPSGHRPDPEKSTATQCQRTGPALTVLVFGPGTGTAGQRQMVGLANAAWAAAGGS